LTPVLLLFGLGLALIIAEVLVPSLGMLGIAAACCVVGSIAWAFSISSGFGFNLLVAAGVLVPGFVMLALKLLPKSPLTRKLMARGFSFEDGRAVDGRDANLMGCRGRAESVLRPAGVARIDGRRVDVVTRGQALEPGTEIEVVELQGNRVVVAPVERPDTMASAAGEPPASTEKPPSSK